MNKTSLTICKRIISDGWTREARQLLMSKIGAANYKTFAEKYVNLLNENPMISIKGSVHKRSIFSHKKDIKISADVNSYLSNVLGIDALENCFQTDLGTGFKDFWLSICKRMLCIKNIKLKNKEKSLKKLEKLDKSMEAIGELEPQVVLKTEPYTLFDVVKTKHRGNSATLQRDESFISETLTGRKDKRKFRKTISEVSEEWKQILSKSESRRFLRHLFDINNKNAQNYIIKSNGKDIGYYSLNIKNDAVYVSNYVVFPEYRNTTSSLNAILTVRDGALETAKKHNLHKITTAVSADNPKLVGLYNRFGFEPTIKRTIEIKDFPSMGFYGLEALV